MQPECSTGKQRDTRSNALWCKARLGRAGVSNTSRVRHEHRRTTLPDRSKKEGKIKKEKEKGKGKEMPRNGLGEFKLKNLNLEFSDEF